jgi:hypothetical protein
MKIVEVDCCTIAVTHLGGRIFFFSSHLFQLVAVVSTLHFRLSWKGFVDDISTYLRGCIS